MTGKTVRAAHEALRPDGPAPFTTMVEPWISVWTLSSGTAALCKPSRTPRASSAGVESAFASATELFVSSKTTTSVNVPPMSTAILKALPPYIFSAPPQGFKTFQPFETSRGSWIYSAG